LEEHIHFRFSRIIGLPQKNSVDNNNSANYCRVDYYR